VAEPGASGFTARPVPRFSGDKGVDLGEIAGAPWRSVAAGAWKAAAR
jgi:hypothetical protein